MLLSPFFLRITSLCHLKHLWTAGLQHQRVWWRTGEQSLSVALREVSTGREGDGWCFWPSTDTMDSRLVQLKLWVFSNQNQLEVWLFLAQTCWDTPDFMLNRLKKKHILPVFNWKNLTYRYVQSLGMFFRMCSYWPETPMSAKGQICQEWFPRSAWHNNQRSKTNLDSLSDINMSTMPPLTQRTLPVTWCEWPSNHGFKVHLSVIHCHRCTPM